MGNDSQQTEQTETRKQLEIVLRKLLPVRSAVRAIREKHREEEKAMRKRHRKELAGAREAAISTEAYLEALLEAMRVSDGGAERADLQSLSDQIKQTGKRHEKALRAWAKESLKA